jgi:hypothetical protein
METKQKKFVLLIVGILLIMSFSTGNAQRVFRYRYVVPVGGSTTSEYCTGYDPCDLRYAIDVIADPGDIIIVHSGTYTSSLPSEDLIFIDKNLSLWGSCEFDSTTPFHCYPDLQNSILDGETTKRVIRVAGSGVEEVLIEGFTIMRGKGTGMVPCFGAMDGCGAGVHASNIEKITLKNNYIWANQAGLTSGVGGGLYADDVNYVLAEDNTFIFNQATGTGLGGGGGAFVYNSGGPHAVVFDQNLFYNNEVSTENISGSAGAGLLIYQSNNAQVTDNNFEYQNAIHQNVSLRGTSVFVSYTSGFSIDGNSFENDWGTSVVTILDSSSNNGSITRNKWWNNLTYYNIELEGEFNIDILNNFLGRQMLSSSLSRGGASTMIKIEGESDTQRINANILFNTFAAANYGVNVGDYADVDIYANIFTELTEGILLSGTTSIHSIDRNLFYNNTTYSTLGTSYIYEDPLLVEVTNGDFHLLPGSGAIDKASAIDFDVDIDGQRRPIGLGTTPYDVGADEFAWPTYLPIIMK